MSPLSFLPFRRVSLLAASVNFLLLLLLLFFFFLRPGGRGSGSGRGRGSGSGRGRGRSRGRGGRYRHRNGMVVLCCFSWFKDRGPSPVHSSRPAPRPASSSMCDDSADDPNDWCLCRGTFMDDSSEEPIQCSECAKYEGQGICQSRGGRDAKRINRACCKGCHDARRKRFGRYYWNELPLSCHPLPLQPPARAAAAAVAETGSSHQGDMPPAAARPPLDQQQMLERLLEPMLETYQQRSWAGRQQREARHTRPRARHPGTGTGMMTGGRGALGAMPSTRRRRPPRGRLERRPRARAKSSHVVTS